MRCEDVVPVGKPSRIASRARGRRRQQLIIEVATRLMMEKGYDGLVLRDVAAGAKIHIGTLNHYFATKQDLLLAIFDQESADYADKMRTAVARAEGREAKIQKMIFVALEELAKPQNALWRILIALAQHDPEAAALLRRENELYHEAVAIELQQIRPDLSAERSRIIGRLVWALLDGHSLQADRFQSTQRLDDAAELDLIGAVSAIANMA